MEQSEILSIRVKICSKCKIEKSLEAFVKDPRYLSGRASRCRLCANSYSREHYKKYPEKVKNRNKKSRCKDVKKTTYKSNLRKHNFTEERYDNLLKQQNYCCAICNSNITFCRGRFHIDHNHGCCPGKKSCGKCVRGLLCARCNGGIGSLNDDPILLRKAAEYLEKKCQD